MVYNDHTYSDVVVRTGFSEMTVGAFCLGRVNHDPAFNVTLREFYVTCQTQQLSPYLEKFADMISISGGGEIFLRNKFGRLCFGDNWQDYLVHILLLVEFAQ